MMKVRAKAKWIAAWMLAAAPAIAQKLAWEHDFNASSGGVMGYAVAADSTGVYFAGQINSPNGSLPGQTAKGGAFVRKYDFSGADVWIRQFEIADQVYAVAAGGGAVYVAGAAAGTFPGQQQDFSEDAYVRKYDRDGNELWTREFGTSQIEFAFGVAADSSGVYVVGETDGSFPGQQNAGDFTKGDVFIRKYDPSGTELWTRQFGLSGGERANAVTVNSTGVYVVGDADGVLPNSQVDGDFHNFFVRKYDAAGNEIWTRQFGPGRHARGTAVDSTGVYVVGDVQVKLPGQTPSGG